MKMKNFPIQGFATLPLLLGALVVILAGVSGYLAYSNLRLQQGTPANVLEAVKEDTLPIATSTPEVTKTEIKKDTLISIPAPASAKKSITAAVVNSQGGWSSFYEELATLEGTFLVDYEDVTLNFSGQSDLIFQQQANDKALAELVKIKAKVSEGRSRFPAQTTCLNKEDLAMDAFKVVIERSGTYLKYEKYTLEVDELNKDLETKLGFYLQRINQQEYNKAMDILEEIRPLLASAQKNAEEANKIIPLQGTRDYIRWASDYSLGLEEVYSSLKAKAYNYKSQTDYVALGEAKTNSISDWSEQLSDWSIANLKTASNNANKLYSESNNSCSKD